jgi:hypothetical protein
MSKSFTKINEPARSDGWTMDLDPSNPAQVIVRDERMASVHLTYEPADADAMVERLIRVTGMRQGTATHLTVQLAEKLVARRVRES